MCEFRLEIARPRGLHGGRDADGRLDVAGAEHVLPVVDNFGYRDGWVYARQLLRFRLDGDRLGGDGACRNISERVRLQTF